MKLPLSEAMIGLLLLGLLTGCTSLPPEPGAPGLPGVPPAPRGGAVALHFSGIVPPFVGLSPATTPALATAVTPASPGDFTITPVASRTVMLSAGRVYLSADFSVKNGGSEPVSRLALLAYAHPSFDAASAISEARLASGQQPLDSFVQRIHPSHALVNVGAAGERRLVGRSGMSDLFALAEAELPAIPAWLAADALLPYGFLVADGATIPPGGEGRVTVAFAFPSGSRPQASLEAFTWNALLVTLPRLRTAQAAEERHPAGWSASLARIKGRPGAELVVLGAGIRSRPPAIACDQLIPLANVRIAGRHAGDARYAGLLPASEAGMPHIDGCLRGEP